MKKLLIALLATVGLLVGLTHTSSATVYPPVWPDETEAWPDATNTGANLSNPTVLNGRQTYTTPYQVVSNTVINGCIDVQTVVYLINVEINTTCNYGIRVFDKIPGSFAYVYDVEINGAAACAYGIGYQNYHAERIDVEGCEDGFKGSDDTRIFTSYIHDLIPPIEGVDHNDGIQLTAGRNVNVAGNNIDVAVSAGIFIEEGTSSLPRDYMVTGNRVVNTRSGGKALNTGADFGSYVNFTNRIVTNIFDAPNGEDFIFSDCVNVITTGNEDLAGNPHTFC